MGSTSSMSCGNKERQLKRQTISPDSPFQEEKNNREIVHRTYQRVVRKHLTILTVLVALAAIIALVLSRYGHYHTFTNYRAVWERDLTVEAQGAAVQGEGSFCGYGDFGGGVPKHTEDGATYLDAKDKVVWAQSYEMRTPVISVSDDFMVIGDRQGNSIYICDKNRTQGQAITLLPILRVTVFAKDMVAALQEDSKANYTYLYKRGGDPLDTMVRSLLSGDGYLVDLGPSPNGIQLVTSCMYLDQGVIKCEIVFYNFGLGKNGPSRVVGTFFPKDLGDAMTSRIRFLDGSHSVMSTDKGIQFFSTRVKTSPELVSQIPIEENIRSITYTQDRVGTVTDSVEGGDPYKLRIHDREGSPVFEKTFNYQYAGFDTGGDLVLLCSDSSCKVYNMIGTGRYNGTFDFTVSKTSAGRFPGALLAVGPQKMTGTKLQ